MVLHKSAFILLCFSVCTSLSDILTDKCTTPDNKPGKCVLLETCPSLNSASNDFETPMTLERLNFLINSQCEFKGNIFTVCCNLEEVADAEQNVLQKSIYNV